MRIAYLRRSHITRGECRRYATPKFVAWTETPIELFAELGKAGSCTPCAVLALSMTAGDATFPGLEPP